MEKHIVFLFFFSSFLYVCVLSLCFSSFFIEQKKSSNLLKNNSIRIIFLLLYLDQRKEKKQQETFFFFVRPFVGLFCVCTAVLFFFVEKEENIYPLFLINVSINNQVVISEHRAEKDVIYFSRNSFPFKP